MVFPLLELALHISLISTSPLRGLRETKSQHSAPEVSKIPGLEKPIIHLKQQLLQTREMENSYSVSRDRLRGCKVRWLTVLFFNSNVLDLLSRGT